MSRPNTLCMLSMAASLALAAPWAATAADGLARADATFIKRAAAAGSMEVELGRMAQSRSSNDAVRQFGKRMEDDHARANDRLQRLAAAKGVELPTVSGRTDGSKLQDKAGADFDREYMKHMVGDHKKDISAFEKAGRSKDPDVKTFAIETLPTLQEHRKLAEQTYASVKSMKASAGERMELRR